MFERTIPIEFKMSVIDIVTGTAPAAIQAARRFGAEVRVFGLNLS